MSLLIVGVTLIVSALCYVVFDEMREFVRDREYGIVFVVATLFLGLLLIIIGVALHLINNA